MSFIKKGLKKIWNFVKKYWKEIVIVAAVVFTAGVATIGGFAAFGNVVAQKGILHAVGSTMWAGITSTATTMGITKGGAAGAAANITGTAGMGLGGGLGWGSAGVGLNTSMAQYAGNAAYHGNMAAGASKAVAKAAAEQATASQIGNTAGIAAQRAAEQAAITQGLGEQEIVAAGQEAFQKASTEAIKDAALSGGGGMSTGKAMMMGSGLSGLGQVGAAYVQGKALEEQNAPPLASWGVALGEDEEYYDQYFGPQAPSAPDPGAALMASQPQTGPNMDMSRVTQQMGGTRVSPYRGGLKRPDEDSLMGAYA